MQALARWLFVRGTGCSFASQIAAKPERYFGFTVPRQVRAGTVDPVLDSAAAKEQPAILLFRFVRSEIQLVEQLIELAKGDRWNLKVETAPEEVGTDDTFLRVEWRTPAGMISSVMGLGPFPTMPVTRRAPFVALALWPGGRLNPLNNYGKEGRVDFLDTKHGHKPSKYKTLWSRSQTETSKLLADPPDNAKHYRTAAFRLGSGVHALLRGS